MRRISLGVILLFLAADITQADYNYLPLRYRVQYNPYAFGYHNNGLVPGGIRYNPYAFKPGASGLAFEGVRYTPYALTYGSTGLVLDYYYYPIPCAIAGPCSYDRVCSGYDSGHKKGQRPGHCDNRGTTVPAPNGAAASARTEDPVAVIRQYLRERGLSNVGIDRIVRVGNELVSVDFTVGGRNLLIKYWNPARLKSAEAGTGRQSDIKSSIESMKIEKYTKEWEAFAGKYQQQGGEIYVVAASGRADIVAALDACEKLRSGDAEPDPSPKYAKQ
jgi:hypothetical protein